MLTKQKCACRQSLVTIRPTRSSNKPFYGNQNFKTVFEPNRNKRANVYEREQSVQQKYLAEAAVVNTQVEKSAIFYDLRHAKVFGWLNIAALAKRDQADDAAGMQQRFCSP